MERFLHSLVSESDRGCVLVGAAHLDRDLEKLLRAMFQHMGKSNKKDIDYLLIGPLAPLRSFSVRIRMAHALGLITSEARKALEAVREIRNDFAHNEEAEQLPAHLVDRAMEWVEKIYSGDEETLRRETESTTKSIRRFQPKASDTRVKLIQGIIHLRIMFTLHNPQSYPSFYPDDD